MRYGVFSDIHGNLEALAAVIEAFAEEKIDRYICVGDIVGYGAEPCECIDRVRKLDPLIVAGNHDWASLGKLNTAYFNPAAKEAVCWTAGILRDEDKWYLGSLRLVEEISELITVVHGTLNAPEEFRYLLDSFSVASAFSLLSTPVGFVGHSHVPITFCLKPDGRIEYSPGGTIKLAAGHKYVINVGSVGQPRDGDERAAYAVYDTEARLVEIRRIVYDIPEAQRKIVRAGLPAPLAARLAVGR